MVNNIAIISVSASLLLYFLQNISQKRRLGFREINKCFHFVLAPYSLFLKKISRQTTFDFTFEISKMLHEVRYVKRKQYLQNTFFATIMCRIKPCNKMNRLLLHDVVSRCNIVQHPCQTNATFNQTFFRNNVVQMLHEILRSFDRRF